MNIRHALGGLAIAGSLTLGLTGVATAATPEGDASTQTQRSFDCDTAQARVAKLLDRIEAAKARLVKAGARIEELRAQGHDDRADALAKRVARLTEHLSKAEARAEKIADRVDERCAEV